MAMNDHCILVVDDQRDYLKAIQLILEGVGYTVATRASAAEALEVLDQRPVDVILADIAMPQMNGYQLFEAVRKRPEWAAIPFIFLTARALDSDIRYGKALGVDDYLTKPIQPEDLLATIEGKLRRRQQLIQGRVQAPPQATDSGEIMIGSLRIDTERHQVWLNDDLVELSAREFTLLAHLARNVGLLVETCDLLQITHSVTASDAAEARELLRPIVRSVRRKLGFAEGESGYIETIRSLGYRMVEPTTD